MGKEKTGMPRHYSDTMAEHPKVYQALETLGKTLREEGPLDGKTAHLIQLAAAATVRSEGSVHSHTRRALQAGATPGEIRHTILLLVSTIGYPTTAAALSWVNDILKGRKSKRGKW
jgi:4-carboxymuconolactone decarboxylase